MDNREEDNQAHVVEEGGSKEKRPRIEAYETSDVSSSISSQVLETDNDISIESADAGAQQLLGMGCSQKQIAHARKICGNDTSVKKMLEFILTMHDDFQEEGCSSSIPVDKWRHLADMGFSDKHIGAAIKECGEQSDTLALVEYIDTHFCDNDPFLPMQNKACLLQPEGCSMSTTVLTHERDKLRQLLSMGFPEEHINTAIKACGEEIDTIDLVEFIHAHFGMSDPKRTMNSEPGRPLPEGCGMSDIPTYETDKWMHLRNMGFSEEHIKAANEACGEDCDTIDLVEFIQAHFCINDPTFNTKNEACSGLVEGCLPSTSTLENGLGMRLKDMGFSDEHIEATIKACGKETSIEMALECIQAICCAQESTLAEEKRLDSSEDDTSLTKTYQKLRNIGFSDSAIGSAIETCESLDFEDLLNFLLEADALYGEELSVDDGCEILDQGSNEAGPAADLATSMKWAEDKVKLWYSYIGTKKDHFPDLGENGGETPCVKNSGFKSNRGRKKKEAQAQKLKDISKALRPDKMRGFAMPGYVLGRPKPLPDSMVGPPFFYFENVAGMPKHEWDTIKRHLHGIDIEFTDSKFFSASRRPRGYVHNLPIEGRKILVPKAPMTIAEALPKAHKYWPWWDTREKLNCINTRRASDTLCEMVRSLCSEYDGGEMMPLQRQQEILQASKKWNLVWVGPGHVAPLEPHEMELLLGFDEGHTRGCSSMTDRYLALGNSFQVDTVGYHLSPLKALYPEGITVLSLFSGIGGAEVALHRLGIPLKAVVSVEKYAKAKTVLESWWKKTNQMGKLNTHYSDVQDLSYNVLTQIVEEVGTIDLIIGGSPCNNLSGCNRVTRTGLEGKDSGLFFEFPRILNLVKKIMIDRMPHKASKGML